MPDSTTKLKKVQRFKNALTPGGIATELERLETEYEALAEKMAQVRAQTEMALGLLSTTLANLEAEKADITDVNTALHSLARQPGPAGIPGRDGKDGLDGLDGKDGLPGKDGSPDLAEDIVFKINTLPPEPDFQIDASHIKNLPATRVVGGGLTQMRADMLYQPLGSSGGVGAWSTPSESVAADGSVVEFTVGTTAPTDLVSDGTTLFEGFGYTYSSPKVTLTNGPTQFIKYR